MSGDYRDEGSFRSHGSHRGGGGEGSGGGGGGGGRGRGSRGSGGGPGGGGSGHGHYERRGIPLSELDPVTTEASRKAIGASIEVHKALGPGFAQDVYVSAVRMELDALGVSYKLGHQMPVMYKDKQVGLATASMLVEGRFLLELLSRPGPVTTHERLTLRAQLKAANLDLGLIINFAERRLKDGLVRVVNIEKITKEKGIVFEDDHDDGGTDLHEFDQH